MPQIVIDGYTPDDKVPGFVGQIKYGQGAISIGEIPLKCTLFGNPTAGGTALVNSKTALFSPEDAVAFFGPRSELARQAYAALDVAGATVECVVVAEASGGAAATATLTIAGSWTGSGQLTIQLDESILNITLSASDSTVTLAAVEVVSATNAAEFGRLFCTAANAAGVVTFTTANVGIRNNQHTLFVVDKSKVPAGMTIAIAGGTALANGGVPFTGGTGTDDITAAITAFDSTQLDYVATAHNDATNAGVVETHLNAKAAFDVQLLDQYVISGNGTQSAAIAIAQTQMNDQIGQFVWVPFGVEHPSRVAARMAALRSVTEGATPNKNYNKVVLQGAAPHFRDQDSPSRSVKKAALNAGMTILETVNGAMQIVRAINSHSLNGSTPDYRTLDCSDTTVPIRVYKETRSLYDSMVQQMPYAGPDIPDTLPDPETFTPFVWKIALTQMMKGFESQNWVTEVDDRPSLTQWDPVGKRVMSATPVVAKLHNNSVGALINQVPA